jgi:hypothetical protein
MFHESKNLGSIVSGFDPFQVSTISVRPQRGRPHSNMFRFCHYWQLLLTATVVSGGYATDRSGNMVEGNDYGDYYTGMGDILTEPPASDKIAYDGDGDGPWPPTNEDAVPCRSCADLESAGVRVRRVRDTPAAAQWTDHECAATLLPSTTEPFRECPGPRSHAAASEWCGAHGLGVCAGNELLFGLASGTGCGYDLHRVWSSSSCGMGDSFWTLAGSPDHRWLRGGAAIGAIPTECRAATEAWPVRCCAMETCPATVAPTSSGGEAWLWNDYRYYYHDPAVEFGADGGLPTSAPSASPSASPSKRPSASPSKRHSASPSASPTESPVGSPFGWPFAVPSASPTKRPVPLWRLGADADEHGCLASAGYQWCPKLSVCRRPFEKNYTCLSCFSHAECFAKDIHEDENAALYSDKKTAIVVTAVVAGVLIISAAVVFVRASRRPPRPDTDAQLESDEDGAESTLTDDEEGATTVSDSAAAAAPSLV